MIPEKTPLYVPALRMKSGELQGLQRLASDIMDHTLPHMIVPPRGERDEETQGILMEMESIPSAGLTLSKYWTGRRVLLNPKYLFDDFGETQCGIWLPKTFEMARNEQVDAVPVISLSDISENRILAFRDAIAADAHIKLALNIESGKLLEPNIVEQVNNILDGLGLTPEDCIVLADFSNDEFSQLEIVTGVIEGALEQLETLGRWHSIVFQGTSYPEVNPASHGNEELVPRIEWKAWLAAVNFSRNTGDHLVFGDYAADCAKMSFGKSGGRAIRHYRYTTPTDWFVVRGVETGRDSAVMKNVCQRILDSNWFAGRSFSSADEFIYRTANDMGGPGNSANWRGINTAHHITRVIRDLGSIKGLQFADLEVKQPTKQFEMFE